jgi:hypothetical protein
VPVTPKDGIWPLVTSGSESRRRTGPIMAHEKRVSEPRREPLSGQPGSVAFDRSTSLRLHFSGGGRQMQAQLAGSIDAVEQAVNSERSACFLPLVWRRS